MQVRLMKSNEDLPSVARVLQQLRTQFTLNDLIAQIQEQRQSGYQIAYVKSGDQVLCVAGFVLTQKLAWGKHIYIDDLVTDASHRSTGAGALLMQWFKAYAVEQGCEQLHLDSGVEKFAAHRFYLRERFRIASHHFAITDLE